METACEPACCQSRNAGNAMLATSRSSIAAAKHHEAERNRRAFTRLKCASNSPDWVVAAGCTPRNRGETASASTMSALAAAFHMQSRLAFQLGCRRQSELGLDVFPMSADRLGA